MIDEAVFAGEIIGFILGRGESRDSKALVPLDQLKKELVFQPKTRQGFLHILGTETDVTRFGIRGMNLRFKARIHGFRHKRGRHLLTALDRRIGKPLDSAFPIYADAVGHFLVKKDFVTTIGVITEHEDTIFVPFGSLAGLPSPRMGLRAAGAKDGASSADPTGMDPYFCLFSVVDEHPGVLFSEGLRIEDERLFAENWIVPASQPSRTDDLSTLEEFVIALTAAVIRVDGVIKTEEIQVVRKFFSQVFQGQPAKMGKMRAILKQFLSRPPSLETMFERIDGRQPQEKQIIIALLLNIASSDGELERSELELIDRIRRRFGIPDPEFEKMTADFQPEDFPCYKALGVAPGASWEEIKEAYRQKAKEYHPDLYPNLPESFREFAKREYQRFNEAYEQLRRKLGQ